MRRARAGAAERAAAAPLFYAARRSGRRRGGRAGREPAGAASAWGQRRTAPGAGPAAAPPPRPGAVLARVAGSGAVVAGVRPPQGGLTCGGARVASRPRRDGKTPLSGRSFVWAPGRPGLSPLAPAPLPSACPQATRSVPGGSSEPREVLGAQRSALGRRRSESFITRGG